jgi:dephospho-CoA kinase
VWLDNSGPPEALTTAVDVLWDGRLAPFAADLLAGRTGPWRSALVDPDTQWPAQAARLSARVAAAAGEWGGAVAHVGSTAVPGLPAADVIDLQLGVETPDAAAAVHDGLRELGFLACGSGEAEPPRVRIPSARCYASADPGRPAHLLVQVTGSPGWRQVLLVRDWLRADAAARASLLQAKRRAAADSGHDHYRYAQLKAAWFDRAMSSAEAWAASSGWAPSLEKAYSAGSP